MHITFLWVLVIWSRTINAEVACEIINYLGCYSVSTDIRTLKFLSSIDENLTHEKCASFCNILNYSFNGVESGNQCFCGNTLDPLAKKQSLSDCHEYNCTGDSDQKCGGNNRMLLFTSSCVGKPTPNYHGCLTKAAKVLPYCNIQLSIEQRVKSLMDSLSLNEKISMITTVFDFDDSPGSHTSNVKRLGLSSSVLFPKTNTGMTSNCLGIDKCATTFSSPMGMSASFNRTSWYLKGNVIGTEIRAFSNVGWHHRQDPDAHIGLKGYGPNVDIVRDPRFGLNSEIPGEDPFLSGHYAASIVRGMQEYDRNGHPKVLAYLKHFTAYSKEYCGYDTHNISMYDLWDTYLAQYELAFKLGKPNGIIYNFHSKNGSSSCLNNYMLNDIVHNKWEMPDVHVISLNNGTAIEMGGNLSSTLQKEAKLNLTSEKEIIAAVRFVAIALNNGTAIEMGGNLSSTPQKEAKLNLTSEKEIIAAVRRSMIGLFKAGRFDPLDNVEWTKIGIDAINSTYHQQIQYEASLQSLVLLKNDNNMLPISSGNSIAVVGPQAVEQYGLLSSYYGDAICPSGTYDCITTIADAITMSNIGGKTTQAKGVDIDSNITSGIQSALDLVKAADVCILVLGISKNQEQEGVDRSDTALPGLQELFAQQVMNIGKPVVLILVNGGALAIDNLVDGSSAIVEAFNPNMAGSRALASSIFGHANRWGKLPVTMYTHDYINQQPIITNDMSKSPGKTYKYYSGKTLWPFGFGLSLTSFNLSCHTKGPYHPVLFAGSDILPPFPEEYVCQVGNTGNMVGDEVVMVFHSVGKDIRLAVDHPIPLKKLVAFERVTVQPGEYQTIHFRLNEEILMLVNKSGDKHLYSGHHSLVFSRGIDEDITFNMTLSPSNVWYSRAIESRDVNKSKNITNPNFLINPRSVLGKVYPRAIESRADNKSKNITNPNFLIHPRSVLGKVYPRSVLVKTRI